MCPGLRSVTISLVLGWSCLLVSGHSLTRTRRRVTRRTPTTVQMLIVLLFVLALVGLVRCPAGQIPELVRALGTWWHIELRL
jgi:hypothetical protein